MSGLPFLPLWFAPCLSSPGTLLCLVAMVVLLVVGVSICSAPAVVCISSDCFFFCFFVLRAVALGWACFSTFPVLAFFLLFPPPQWMWRRLLWPLAFSPPRWSRWPRRRRPL